MEMMLRIQTTKFPPLEGEEQELVNEGMYGKALAIYLQEKLIHLGYTVPWFCPEDWGWWVEIKGPIKMGVCIYHEQSYDGVREFLVADGILSTRKWSFKAFRWIDHSHLKAALLSDLLQIFQNDPDIRLLEHDR